MGNRRNRDRKDTPRLRKSRWLYGQRKLHQNEDIENNTCVVQISDAADAPGSAGGAAGSRCSSGSPSSSGAAAGGRSESVALSDITNSPAVLTCLQPERVFSARPLHEKNIEKPQAESSVTSETPQRKRKAIIACFAHSDEPNRKRLRLDQAAAATPASDSEGDASQELLVESGEAADNYDKIKGRYITNLSHVLRQHEAVLQHAKTCTGGRMQLQRETRRGLYSLLVFQCHICGKTMTLDTDPGRKSINTALAWASVAVGNGFAQAQEFLSILDVTAPSYNIYRNHERVVGEVWKSAFEKLRKEAVEEEKELARNSKNVDKNNMPYVTVKTDGGWCKRTYGHGYAAKSGVACIIGRETGKLLYLGVENKFCKICSNASGKKTEPGPHKCNATYKGPSTGMEAAIIVRGCKTLHKEGLWVKKIIGDGDSSVFNQVRQFTPQGRECEKVECANHTARRYTTRLHKIVKKKFLDVRARKMIANAVPRLTAAARGAMRTNAGKSITQLKADLRNGPQHVFGNHQKCRQTFCQRKDSGEPDLTEQAKALGVLDEVYGALQPLYSEAHKLEDNETTNDCESFMSKVSKLTGGKRADFSTGPSFGIRCFGAALLFSLGPAWHLKVWRDWQDGALGEAPRKVLEQRERCNAQRRAVRDVQRAARAAGEWTGRRRAAGGADEHYGRTPDMILQEYPDVPADVLHARMFAEYERIEGEVPDAEASKALEQSTRGQSSNPRWMQIRSSRIQGYKHGRVKSLQPTSLRGPVVKELYLPKSLDHLEHIQLGRSAEQVAKEKYMARFGATNNGISSSISSFTLSGTP
ncbi:Endoribonuclease YbeY [Frankliniella fusca]|uniref:Endoribonuclease YbeY n=1 Tax=Frankliniella fusca TaxID=407009 RepID=A0AAE1HMW2_9NEOP|nr:Endoribonuclease YbeY [Frankliniella fusca]